jgi:glycosyltransferase involved in cell wall biosynthesis
LEKIKKLSVITTFYNEENIISNFITELRKVLIKLKVDSKILQYEIIVVDDRSIDNSLEAINSVAGNLDIRYVLLSRRFGVYESIYAGMSLAEGDWVVYMDCDLQDPPSHIETMINRLYENQNNRVTAVHAKRSRRLGENIVKKTVTKIGYLFINKISYVEVPVDVGDFKLISRELVKFILNHAEHRAYMRAIVADYGGTQLQTEYVRESRLGGGKNSKRKFYSSTVFWFWMESALIQYSKKPLKMFFWLWIVWPFLVFSILLSTKYMFGLYDLPIFVISIFLSLWMIGCNLSVLGLYLYDTFLTVKNREIYRIEKIKLI